MRARVSLALVLLASMLAARARADETCVDCHAMRSEERLRAPVVARAHDVHADAAVVCSDCHGGDPSEPSVRAHDAARGFRGIPDALGVARLCGRCHDGSREDAHATLADFRQGHHGRALATGREAATCTDCHQPHGTTSANEDGSRTSHEGAVATCTACHSDARRMAASGLPTDQGRRWAASVHGQYVEAGAATCVDCHDAHRASTGLDAVACGRCHEVERAAFDRGPHAAEYARLGFLDCIECHGNHDIRVPDRAMLEGAHAICARCHAPGQEAMTRVERIAARATEIDAARARLAPDDPARLAVLDALHALDVDALDHALASLPPAPPAPPPPAPPAETPWVTILIGTWLGALALGIARALWSRRRRP